MTIYGKRAVKTRIRWWLLCSVVIVWSLIWILKTNFSAESHSDPMMMADELPHRYRVNLFDRRKSTVILLYSKSDSRGIGTLDHQYFSRMKCPLISCIVTTNRSYLPVIQDYDAIVFSHNKIQNRIGKLPVSRSLKQNYILHLDRPSENDCITTEFRNYFNMTMSYRFDSDIHFLNGRVISKETQKQVAPARYPDWGQIPSRPRIRRRILKKIQKKTRLAAWIMSECPKKGQRAKNYDLIDALQKYFRIDIAGPCGNLKCYSQEDCLEKIEKDYKFILHVEDVFSPSYITSDTYFLMRYNIVPILFGAVRYNQFLPKKSFISANSYKSPDQLGELVHRIDGNIIEYAMYFWWKAYFYIQHYPNYCDLCEKTRTFRMSNRTRYYKDLNLWLDPGEKQYLVNRDHDVEEKKKERG